MVLKIFFLLNFCFSVALNAHISTTLVDHLKEPPPYWKDAQIGKDLSFFYESGITQKDLDNVLRQFKNDPHVVYFKIKNNKVKTIRPCKVFEDPESERCFYVRFASVYKMIKLLASNKLLPDVFFIISMLDCISYDAEGPIMAFAKNKHAKNVIAFPDFEATSGYTLLKKEISRASHHSPFHQKIEKVYWRGSSTGGLYTKDSWKTFPRVIACLYSNTYPELIDAKLTNLVQFKDLATIEKVKENNLTGSPSSKSEHIQYKYLLDIDGNSCTYSRFYWILLSNSTCLKQITNDEQWYYSGLIPNTHNIPIKEDLSDLMEKITWAKEHPFECERIAKNATHFIQSNLRSYDIIKYIYLLLNEYAKLQKL